MHVLEASGAALGAEYCGWGDAARNVVEDGILQSATTLDSTDEDAADNAITSKILEQYTALKDETAKIESAIDNAAEEEDYEAAPELEEKLESVCAGIEALGVSPADLKDALTLKTMARLSKMHSSQSHQKMIFLKMKTRIWLLPRQRVRKKKMKHHLL